MARIRDYKSELPNGVTLGTLVLGWNGTAAPSGVAFGSVDSRNPADGVIVLAQFKHVGWEDENFEKSSAARFCVGDNTWVDNIQIFEGTLPAPTLAKEIEESEKSLENKRHELRIAEQKAAV